MRRGRSIICLAVLLLNTWICGFAEVHVVGSMSGFTAAHNAAAAGDTIVWKQGLYYNIDLQINKSNLLIMAEIPGKTVFTGASKVYISGSYNTISGFQYLNGNIGTDDVIVVTGSYNHLTQLNIQNYFSYKYVVIDEQSEYNMLSYCNLENRTYIGNKNILSILLNENKPGYHTIRYCSFKDFEGTGGDMGTEPIRIGLSTQGEFISRSVVEYCYFTLCNGDGEIISNKSRQNVFRYNTFQNNPLGELVLRHGDEGVVYGNFFLNGMGGVRIKEGQHHVVFNNYFSGLTGRAINLQNYEVDPLDQITIAYNTVVNSAKIDLGASGSYPPKNVCFANNIFADPAGSLFTNATGSETWIGNISRGSLGIDRPAGIRDADPGFELNSEGFYGLSAGSTAIDSAQPGYPVLPDYPVVGIDYGISLDLMQQARPEDIALKDIGCSEFPHDVMIQPYVNENNTGPYYLHEEDYHILKVTIQGGGTVLLDPPSGVYDSGTVVTLTANPSTYRFFREWGGDLQGNSNTETLVMNASKHVTAHFETYPLNKIDIYFAGPGHVEVDPPGWSYPDSTLITLTAIPDPGYIFSHWSGQLTGTENPVTLVVTGDIISFANFREPAVGTLEHRMPASMTDPYVLRTYPNPSSGTMNISFVIDRESTIELSLYDLNGTEVRKVQQGRMVPGSHRMELDLSELPEGVYFLTMNVLAGSQDQYSNSPVVRKVVKISR